MRVHCVGGGPAGLYAAILLRKTDPRHRITVHERNPRGVTHGFGVVFSDETLGNLEEADRETHDAITAGFTRWKDIDIHYRGECLRSTGHGFCGISRRRLLEILEDRALELGVEVLHEREVGDARDLGDADLVIAADGVRSRLREAHAQVFRPAIEPGRCRYIWLGSDLRLDAFTFVFDETEAGWLAVHAYRFDDRTSTFIVECHESTWSGLGFDRMPVEDAIAWLERRFAPVLRGARLLSNRSAWISFPTLRNATWHHGNVVLAGDSAHTAHFSIGSGTKLALEDAIALARAVATAPSLKTALERYDEERRPVVARLQKAARESRVWFENVARYAAFDPPQFAFSLLTRSRRISYDNLKLRDPALVERVARWVEERAARAAARTPAAPAALQDAAMPPSPPMFTPFRLRDLVLENRVVVSPMCMYSAADGTPGDFHLVHLGSRAQGGAGLVFTEMTNVAAEARISPGCAGMYRPEHVAAWKRIVDFVHAHTRARIGLQLGHAGRKGSCAVPWQGGEPLTTGGWELVAPSPVPFQPGHPVPRAMERADMDRVRDQFVAAARMAVEAGFDLLELHMAHGYLLSSFLTPLSNRRSDEYGGALGNRLRFPLEVFRAVRAAWPERLPMSVRISATDWVEGGFTGDDAVAVARALRDEGLDIVDVSAGMTSPDARPIYGRGFQTPFSDQVRNEARIPTIAVGNITSADEVNSIVAAGRADLVALARRHLYDPYFSLHAAAELGQDVDWPPPYLAARPPRRG